MIEGPDLFLPSCRHRCVRSEAGYIFQGCEIVMWLSEIRVSTYVLPPFAQVIRLMKAFDARISFLPRCFLCASIVTCARNTRESIGDSSYLATFLQRDARCRHSIIRRRSLSFRPCVPTTSDALSSGTWVICRRSYRYVNQISRLSVYDPECHAEIAIRFTMTISNSNREYNSPRRSN